MLDLLGSLSLSLVPCLSRLRQRPCQSLPPACAFRQPGGLSPGPYLFYSPTRSTGCLCGSEIAPWNIGYRRLSSSSRGTWRSCRVLDGHVHHQARRPPSPASLATTPPCGVASTARAMVPVTAPRERAFGVGTPPRVSSQAGRTHAATSDDRPALVPRRVRDLDRRPRGRAQRGAPSAYPAGGSVRDLGFPMIAASSGASIGAPERPGEPAPLCERRARGNSTRRDWTRA